MTDLNLPTETESASDDQVLIGGRVTREEAGDVDIARVIGGYRNRSDYVVAVVMRETRKLLKRQRATDRDDAA